MRNLNVYITGDTHGKFDRVQYFCQEHKTNTDDVLIILGDTGINYYLNYKDKQLKEWLSNLPITLFCIRGNHEERPSNIDTYKTGKFFDGDIYYEEEYPNLIFAKDGEVYNINGKKCLVIGGAYSVDKQFRLAAGWHWFKDEQLSIAEKADIEEHIKKCGSKFDYILTHTCPYDTRPIHLFLDGIDQSTVDNSTEKWLQFITSTISFDKWYFGHFHGDWENGKYTMLYNNIIKLGE